MDDSEQAASVSATRDDHLVIEVPNRLSRIRKVHVMHYVLNCLQNRETQPKLTGPAVHCACWPSGLCVDLSRRLILIKWY